MNTMLKQLDTYQTKQFDVEYINDALFSIIVSSFEKYLDTNKTLNFLDVGGGNGAYSDRLLKQFSKFNVTLLEPDRYLLGRNIYNPRKTIAEGVFQDYQCKNNCFDIIQFNWVLHHFVCHGYSKTCDVQKASLQKAYDLLRPGGLLVIFENYYDGFVVEDLPGTMIYHLTSSVLLKDFIQKMGANTAGVGVCFHSQSAWQEMVLAAGFDMLKNQHCYDFGDLSALKKSVLLIKNQHVGIIVAWKPPVD